MATDRITRDAAKQATCRILPRPGDGVKQQITGAGVPLGRLARAAGISQSYLSQMIHGQRGSYNVRLVIWGAFRRLTGRRVTFPEFWGPLMKDEMKEVA